MTKRDRLWDKVESINKENDRKDREKTQYPSDELVFFSSSMKKERIKKQCWYTGMFTQFQKEVFQTRKLQTSSVNSGNEGRVVRHSEIS